MFEPCTVMDNAKGIREMRIRGMSIQSIAERAGRSASWIASVDTLMDLIPEAQKAVAEGQMPLSNAYRLACLNPGMQPEMMQEAMTLPMNDFAIRAKHANRVFFLRQRKIRDSMMCG